MPSPFPNMADNIGWQRCHGPRDQQENLHWRIYKYLDDQHDPRQGMMKPITSWIPHTQPPLLVLELIDATSVVWSEDLVCSIFLPIDVEAI